MQTELTVVGVSTENGRPVRAPAALKPDQEFVTTLPLLGEVLIVEVVELKGKLVAYLTVDMTVSLIMTLG